MTEEAVAKCIAPNCKHNAAIDSPLCFFHKEQLRRIEDDLLKDATRKVRAQVRQFERLSLVEPPLHSAEIAHRMAEPMRTVRRLLKQFKDDRA